VEPVTVTIGEALEQLRAHWGEVHVSVRSGVATVSDTSSAKRAWSGSRSGAPRVYEQPSLAAALTVAINGEGLG
jgi:hypothetical protein